MIWDDLLPRAAPVAYDSSAAESQSTLVEDSRRPQSVRPTAPKPAICAYRHAEGLERSADRADHVLHEGSVVMLSSSPIGLVLLMIEAGTDDLRPILDTKGA